MKDGQYFTILGFLLIILSHLSNQASFEPQVCSMSGAVAMGLACADGCRDMWKRYRSKKRPPESKG